MLRVISDGVWAEINRLGRGTTKFAAIAYVTSDHIKFKRGDVLVCDASDGSVGAGQTSVSVLRKAHTRRAKLYSSSGLQPPKKAMIWTSSSGRWSAWSGAAKGGHMPPSSINHPADATFFSNYEPARRNIRLSTRSHHRC